MTFVDSSVLIDFFNDVATPQMLFFEGLVSDGARIIIGDLVFAEVLQGFANDEDAQTAERLLQQFEFSEVVGYDCTVKAALNYRILRRRGFTIRKTIDGLIATRCIMNDVPLLARDRDFEPFYEHLGLRRAMPLH